jgi:hypothetical protein
MSSAAVIIVAENAASACSFDACAHVLEKQIYQPANGRGEDYRKQDLAQIRLG